VTVNGDEHGRWQEDLAAYALGALGPEDARAVEAHLAGCERCRADLRWLEPAVDVLAESVVQLSPPPRVRDELLAITSGEARRAEPGGRRGWRAWVLRPVTALAATAIVAAGVAGYALRGGEDEGDQSVAFETAPAAGNAVAVLDRHGDSGTLRLTNLPPVEGSGVYQVWIAEGDAVEPSSAFRPDPDGEATATIPSGLDGADAVMVTREPERGRTTPSLPAVFRTDLD
jgi:anti-sigma-K factor RskA